MTYIFSTNNTDYGIGPDTAPFGDKVWYDWKTFMKTAGWTVKESSDGTTLNTSSDIITGYATGANGLGNASAFYVMREPAGGINSSRREFLVFKAAATGASNSTGRIISYSPTGFSTTLGHNSVAISATNPPIAFDEVVISSWYGTTAYLTTLQAQGFFNYDLVNLGDDFYQNYSGSHGWNSYIWNSINSDIHIPGLYYSFYASNAAPFSFYILVSSPEVPSSSGFIKNKVVQLG